MSAYTDEDVETAYRTWVASGSDVRGSIREMFDAVAPAIAARALREAASDYGTPGASATTSYVRGFLRDRADEIEAGR